MSLVRRFVAFAALVVLVAVGRARLLEADEARTGFGEDEGEGEDDGKGSIRANRTDTRM